MRKILTRHTKRQRRHRRVRAKIFGTPDRPRFSVFKSNRFLYGQLIDDVHGTTLLSVSTRGMTGHGGEALKALGRALAEKAHKAGIRRVVFDRGGFTFTGNLKAFADGAREGGLLF